MRTSLLHVVMAVGGKYELTNLLNLLENPITFPLAFFISFFLLLVGCVEGGRQNIDFLQPQHTAPFLTRWLCHVCLQFSTVKSWCRTTVHCLYFKVVRDILAATLVLILWFQPYLYT